MVTIVIDARMYRLHRFMFAGCGGRERCWHWEAEWKFPRVGAQTTVPLHSGIEPSTCIMCSKHITEITVILRNKQTFTYSERLSGGTSQEMLVILDVLYTASMAN